MRHGKCYGSTVMGERGQVVIPAEAREEIGLEPGEKLLVFGNPDRGVIIIFKSDIMARFADMLLKKAGFFEEMFKGIHKGHGHGHWHGRKGRKSTKPKDIDPDEQPQE
ncbi:MAG: AbrB/MazE/SpoVT family DNA-binding domain-containing protein [Thermincola sp.]|jgi:AbrB family looped-hinge helix DNA binding protein|nr:AbrB/MazE/SpoVT family DNA-binding domain-containing protein [Thermincola sp.]MDT3703810.1 AbrB/MazE/SpoVT family DNA-binding domain-containing protein [Thermincola sp.]